MRTQILQSLFLILFLPFAMVSQNCFDEILPNGGDCNSAVFLCGSLFDGHTGTLPSMPTDTSVGSHPDVLCVGGDVDNIQWYSFIPCESSIELDITPGSCTSTLTTQFGLQTGVYEDCSFGNPLFCYAEQGVDVINIVLEDLIPGTIYYLFVDGYAGSVCDYSFDVISGIDTSEPIQPDDIQVDLMVSDTIKSDTIICEGDELKISFEVPNLNIGGFSCGDISPEDLGYVACFEWFVNGVSINTGAGVIYDYAEGDNSTCASFVFYEEGEYNIDVVAEFNPAVFNGPESCTVANVEFNSVDVVIRDRVLEVLDVLEFCEGTEYEFCESIFTTDTIVECERQCTLFLQPLVFLPTDDIDLGIIYICDNECFEFEGELYCDVGVYEVLDTATCISTSFSLDLLNATIDFGGEDEISCDLESITLNPNYTINNSSPLNYQWLDGNNIPLGNGASIDVSAAGIYTVMVTADDIATDCILVHTIEITESSDNPILMITPPMITCDDPNGVIMVSSSIDIQSAIWTGPGVFDMNEISPTVSEIGMYSVTITAVNGCTSTESVMVTGDIGEPTLTVDYRDIDCNVLQVVATYTADVPVRSQQWSGPGLESNDPSIIITQAGNYILTVTAFNGCQTSEIFTVNDIRVWPAVDAGQDKLWNCNTQSIEIIAGIPTGAQYDYQWNLIAGDTFTAMANDRIEANSIGEYEIVVTNVDLGCVTRDTVAVINNEDVPTAFIGEAADPLCFYEDNGFITIESVVGGAAPYTITIDGNPVLISEVLNDLADGSYDLDIVDNNGCTYSEELTLTRPMEIILDAPEEINIKYYANESLVLEYSVDDVDVAEINWYNAQDELIGQGESIEFIEERSTVYTVELITVDGCSATQEIEIRVDNSVDVYVPNIFSPNGDGANDIFWIHGEDDNIMIETLAIYDRWGSLVYETKDMPVGESARGWDGTFNGQTVNPGVFVYVLEIRTASNEVFVKSGDITVVR